MKHARTDYAEIQDPTGKIPAEEPVFLLRAQDKVSVDTVLHWAKLAENAGAPKVMVIEARIQAGKMFVWQRYHKVKVPDIPCLVKFAVGQKVKVVKILDDITNKDLLGFTGTVREVDPLPNGEYNYDVDGHYLNEPMLELVSAAQVDVTEEMVERGVDTVLSLASHWYPGMPLHISEAQAETLITKYNLTLYCGAGDMSGEAHALFEHNGETIRLKRNWMKRYELYHGEWQPDPHWTGD